MQQIGKRRHYVHHGSCDQWRRFMPALHSGREAPGELELTYILRGDVGQTAVAGRGEVAGRHHPLTVIRRTASRCVSDGGGQAAGCGLLEGEPTFSGRNTADRGKEEPERSNRTPARRCHSVQPRLREGHHCSRAESWVSPWQGCCDPRYTAFRLSGQPWHSGEPYAR
jgi:hypothetical protein